MAHKNRIGNLYSLTSFGESHGPAIGGVIDGMPSGVRIDIDELQREMDRRRPGQGGLTSSRNEPDKIEILSGLMDGVTLGTPIGFIIRNLDQRSEDYYHLKDVFRPSHADFTWQMKYGIRDYRGGGRASARETATRMVAGAFAKQALEQVGIVITGKVLKPDNPPTLKAGYTIGGVVLCSIKGVPPGIGEPVFGKLSAQLAEAIMSIPASKGFEYGMGFEGANYTGSMCLDEFIYEDGEIKTRTNFSGGIQGGISNGNEIWFRVAFKPVATLMKEVKGIDINGNEVIIKPKGRYDACVVPRAVPIVEAMAAIVLFDNYLMSRVSKF